MEVEKNKIYINKLTEEKVIVESIETQGEDKFVNYRKLDVTDKKNSFRKYYYQFIQLFRLY